MGAGSVVYGTHVNLDMAAYVHAFLTGILEPLWKDYRRRKGLSGNRERLRSAISVRSAATKHGNG